MTNVLHITNHPTNLLACVFSIAVGSANLNSLLLLSGYSSQYRSPGVNDRQDIYPEKMPPRIFCSALVPIQSAFPNSLHLHRSNGGTLELPTSRPTPPSYPSTSSPLQRLGSQQRTLQLQLPSQPPTRSHTPQDQRGAEEGLVITADDFVPYFTTFFSSRSTFLAELLRYVDGAEKSPCTQFQHFLLALN